MIAFIVVRDGVGIMKDAVGEGEIVEMHPLGRPMLAITRIGGSMDGKGKTAVITVTFYRGVQEPSLDRLNKKYVVKRWRDEAHLRELLDDIAREMNYISGYGIWSIKVKAEQLIYTVDYRELCKPYMLDIVPHVHDEFWFSLRFTVGRSHSSITRFIIPRLNVMEDKIIKYDPNDNLLRIRTVPYGSRESRKRAKSRYYLYFDSENPILNSFLRRISADGELEPQTSTQWHPIDNVNHTYISWWHLPNSQITLYKIKKLRERKEKEERKRKQLEKSGIIYADRAKKKKADQVYLIKMDDDSLAEPVYKIGISNAPGKRLQTLNTSSPFALTIVHKFVADPALEAEAQLHLRFQDNRLSGEWFRLSKEQLVELKKIVGFEKGAFVCESG